MGDNGWDGVWSALLGGLLSAVTVLMGVLLAQRLADARARRANVRRDANALLIQVQNARDAAVHSRSRARSGTYDLWPLRQQIYLSHALAELPVRRAVQDFYQAVWALRDWARRHPNVGGRTKSGGPSDDPAFVHYGEALSV